MRRQRTEAEGRQGIVFSRSQLPFPSSSSPHSMSVSLETAPKKGAVLLPPSSWPPCRVSSLTAARPSLPWSRRCRRPVQHYGLLLRLPLLLLRELHQHQQGRQHLVDALRPPRHTRRAALGPSPALAARLSLSAIHAPQHTCRAFKERGRLEGRTKRERTALVDSGRRVFQRRFQKLCQLLCPLTGAEREKKGQGATNVSVWSLKSTGRGGSTRQKRNVLGICRENLRRLPAVHLVDLGGSGVRR